MNNNEHNYKSFDDFFTNINDLLGGAFSSEDVDTLYPRPWDKANNVVKKISNNIKNTDELPKVITGNVTKEELDSNKKIKEDRIKAKSEKYEDYKFFEIAIPGFSKDQIKVKFNFENFEFVIEAENNQFGIRRFIQPIYKKNNETFDVSNVIIEYENCILTVYFKYDVKRKDYEFTL